MTNSNYYCELGVCNHKSCKEVETINYIQDLTNDYIWWIKYEPKSDEEAAIKLEGVQWFKKTIEHWKGYLDRNF